MIDETAHIDRAAAALDDDLALTGHMFGQGDAGDDLTAAIALIRAVTPDTSPWTGTDFVDSPGECTDTDEAIATILNAVIDGRLSQGAAPQITARPASEVRAEALREAVRLIETAGSKTGNRWIERKSIRAAVLSLIDTPAPQPDNRIGGQHK